MTRALMGMAAAAALLAGAGGAEAASVSHGRQLAQRNCGMCHAIGPTGESRHKPAPPFRTLSQRYPIEMLAESLAEGMLTGHPEMPEFRFDPPDIQDLIAYIKSVQTRAVAHATTSRLPAR